MKIFAINPNNAKDVKEFKNSKELLAYYDNSYSNLAEFKRNSGYYVAKGNDIEEAKQKAGIATVSKKNGKVIVE